MPDTKDLAKEWLKVPYTTELMICLMHTEQGTEKSEGFYDGVRTAVTIHLSAWLIENHTDHARYHVTQSVLRDAKDIMKGRQ